MGSIPVTNPGYTKLGKWKGNFENLRFFLAYNILFESLEGLFNIWKEDFNGSSKVTQPFQKPIWKIELDVFVENINHQWWLSFFFFFLVNCKLHP